MFEQQWDQEIQTGLQKAADHVGADERCRERINARISRAEIIRMNGGSDAMRKWTWKKTVLAAAACCLLIGGTVYAAGTIESIRGSSSSIYDTREYADISALEEKADFHSVYVEEFRNGFVFDGANLVHSEGDDTEGNTVSTWEELSLTYRDNEDRKVMIDMEPWEILGQDLSKDALEEKVVEDIPMYYTRVEYLLVPPDYEATQEELDRRESDPHFTISYGADERQTVFFSDVAFKMDDIKYLVLTSEDMGADDLFSMAEEIIAANGK